MHGMYVRPSESSDVALSRVGYWSRDEMVKMDRAATLRMLRFHPARASASLKNALAKGMVKEEEPIVAPQVIDSPTPEKYDLLQAAAAAGSNEDISVLTRQIVLFLLSEQYGAEMAAEALHTIVESVRAARKRIAPDVAALALEIAPTVECFNRILAQLSTLTELRLTKKDIIAICSKVFGISVRDLQSARRTRGIASARQVAMFICKRLTLSSYPEIGKSFGGRDHTTVLHAVRKMEGIAGEHGVDCGDDPQAWAVAFAGMLGGLPRVRERQAG